MLVITGSGRCGTSLLMKFIGKCGYSLGVVHWNRRINAGYELLDLRLIHRRFHHAMEIGDTSQADTWGRRLVAKVKNLKRKGVVEVVKDPKITWHPKIIEYWHMADPSLRVLLLRRDFEDVLESHKLMMENRRSRVPLRKVTIADLRRNHHEFKKMLHRLEIPYRLLRFPDFVLSYDRVYRVLRELELKIDREEGEKVWNRIVNLSLVHFGLEERDNAYITEGVL